ncbi:unnamed protein product, partial [Didymodactylos carnosus]
KLLGMQNLLTTEDDVHSSHRKMIQPVFQHQNLVSMQSLMIDTTSIQLDKWKKQIDKRSEKSINLEMRSEMSILTLDIVTACVFGTGLIEDEKVHDIIHQSVINGLSALERRMFNMTGFLPIIKSLPLSSKLKLDKANKDLNIVVNKIVSDRREALTHSACKGSE